MNRILTTATLMILVLVSPPALAVEDDRAAQFEQRMEHIRDRLNLTDEQVDETAPVLEKSMQKQQGILSSYGIDLQSSGSTGRLGIRRARAMKQELDVVRADTLDALEGILNDEQLGEFKLIQQERQAEMRERIRGGR